MCEDNDLFIYLYAFYNIAFLYFSFFLYIYVKN